MEFVIWVETRIAGRTADIRQVATVERAAGIKAEEEIGLSLADGKVVIRQIQRRIVEMTVSGVQLEDSISGLIDEIFALNELRQKTELGLTPSVDGSIPLTANPISDFFSGWQ